MTKDYFKKVVATDIITKAMQMAEAKDERTQKAYADQLTGQILTYCQANGLTHDQLLDVVLKGIE